MPVGYNISDDISSFVNTIWEEAVLVARDQSILPALVHNFADRSGTAVRTRSEYGTVTFGQVSDYDDLTSQQFKPSSANTLTPYEFGAQFVLTDQRRESDPFSVQAEARQELGAGAAQKIQMDIASQFGSLTGGTVGTAGGTITWTNILAAQALLRQQNAPGPYFCVLQPGQAYYLGTVLAPAAAVTNAPGLQDEFWMGSEYFIGRAFGINFFVSADITSGTAAKGAMFSRDAIGYDVRRGFRIEPERNASLRAWELNASMVYGAGVWRPKFGVQIIGTSTVS